MAPRKGRSLVNDRQFSIVVKNLSGGYKTITELVYAVLKETIISGAFAPGEWLRQESIAEAIGVSRIPVRTALVQLESEGMITFHPHRGARVRTLTPEQVDEIYRLRILLETYAISRVFAAPIDPGRLARLRSMASQLDKQPQGSEFLDLRIEFYRELYDSRNNPLLVQMIDDLRSHVGRYYLGFKFPHRDRHHTDLVERIATGDLEGATAWLTAHFDTVRSGIRELAVLDSADEGATSAPSDGAVAADGEDNRTVGRQQREPRRPRPTRVGSADG